MTPTLFAQAVAGGRNPWSVLPLVVIVVIFLGSLTACLLFARYFNLWIQAKMTGAGVGLPEMIGMSLRKVNPNVIVRSKIMARQAGLTEDDGLTTQRLSEHYLAGGDVSKVVRGLVAAKQDNVRMTFEQAAALDLAGREILKAAPERRRT